MKLKLWIVEDGVSVRFVEISIEGKDSINREDLLMYIRSNFGRLILRNSHSKRLFYQYKK